MNQTRASWVFKMMDYTRRLQEVLSVLKGLDDLEYAPSNYGGTLTDYDCPEGLTAADMVSAVAALRSVYLAFTTPIAKIVQP